MLSLPALRCGAMRDQGSAAGAHAARRNRVRASDRIRRNRRAKPDPNPSRHACENRECGSNRDRNRRHRPSDHEWPRYTFKFKPVHKHITTLEKKGFIRRGYNQSRSIEIVQLPKSVKDQVNDRKMQELPLVGRIAAGRPLEAVEERETISLGDFARGGNSFVLQVKGSSMIEDHIVDGDYVVCEQTQAANPGDIGVALVGGEEATLKRFYREGAGKVRLQPANSDMAPIMVAANDLKIQGRVIGRHHN